MSASPLTMKRVLLSLVVFVVVVLFQFDGKERLADQSALAPSALQSTTLIRAIESQADGVQVNGSGVVIKVLRDDNDGSRHQRFIVRLASGQTLLMAHNIDLARRVSPLHEGDTVSFNGEYVWNANGGVVHWTHRDPRKRHADGWIERQGQMFH